MGGDHAAPPRVPPNEQDCKDNLIDIGWRDYCSHLLIPLNKCRYREFFLPWKCEKERHAYEACQYHEFQYRMKKLQESKQ
mmetsp:Transcript_36928/g.94334  ORF Transcript_36928/g.94334 Transcript_36928/m.94334 type:complete len:80 (+) Transcript_36928:3-242(+)